MAVRRPVRPVSARAVLARRDAMLEAITIGATDLLRASDPTPVLHKVLRRAGAAAGASRVHLYKVRMTDAGAPLATERCLWAAPGFAVPPGRRRVVEENMETAGIGSWAPRLARGEVITGIVADFKLQLRKFLELNQTLAVLVAPIFVGGEWWGQIAFDNCREERNWSPTEIDTIKTLAELIGAAFARAGAERALADANRIVEGSPMLIFRLAATPDARLTYISHNIQRYGYSAKELLAGRPHWTEAFHPDDARVMASTIRDVLGNGGEGDQREFRMRRADGAFVWFEGRMSVLRDKDGQSLALEGVAVDIDDRKRAEQRIAQLVSTDPLTGLANRRAFIERLHHAFAAAKHGRGGFAVLYMDLDGFKDINDVHGHATGDMLLRLVAERLKGGVRASDVVARLGGDEFAVLQVGVKDAAGPTALASNIINAFAPAFRIDGDDIHIRTSIGIAPYASALHDPDALLAQADLALYRAKDDGGACFRFHDPAQDRRVLDRLTLSNELHAALKRDEFELVYQPEVEIASGRIVGLEALARWNHPTRGVLAPADFIPAAERSGVIVPLGRALFEKACDQIQAWREDGVAPRVVAVNVSALQFNGHTDFVPELAAALARRNIPPDAIELELTESVLLDVFQRRNSDLERLKRMGVRIAIDDFGIGYSSLTYLARYPISRLKIAQELIRRVTVGGRNATVVRAAIRLGRELGIEVIAEGVANARQAAFLVEAGCDRAQGFYFSRPVSAKRAGALLRKGFVARPGLRPGLRDAPPTSGRPGRIASRAPLPAP